MKRFHVHVGVENLDASIAFYANLFAAAPSVIKPDYAKWMLDDPHVNFAISSGEKVRPGIEHIGIQAENEGELEDVYARLTSAGRPVLDEGATNCCYTTSTKNWTSDPDGVIWEVFQTNGETTNYGQKISLDGDFAAACNNLDALESANAAVGMCCAPELAAALPKQTACC